MLYGLVYWRVERNENMEFVVGINQKEHDDFVKKSDYCHLLQSSLWGHIKSEWKYELIGVYQNNHLIASALVLIRPLPLGFTMVYLPKGPVLDYSNHDVLSFYFQELKKWAKKKRCLYIKIDPLVHYADYHLNEDKIVNQESIQIIDQLKGIGFHHYGLTTQMSETIQPRLQMAVYKDQFGFDFLTKKGKKNLKIAEKKNFETVITDATQIEDFARVMNCTAMRKGIGLRNQDYYQRIMDTYQEDAFLTLTYLDIQTTYQQIKERYEQCLKDIETCPENAKKKRFKLEETLASLSREVHDFENHLKNYGEKACVCGTLTVVYGSTSEILYAGMDNQFKRYMGPYLTWYKTMEECFVRHCDVSNMGGVEGNLKGGLTDYKSAFYPVVNEYIGEFDLVIRPVLYQLFQWALLLRKKLRH